MMLLLQRTPEREAALEQFINEIHDPKSPLFHHWITAAELGQDYGVTPAELAAATVAGEASLGLATTVSVRAAAVIAINCARSASSAAMVWLPGTISMAWADVAIVAAAGA